MEKTAMYKSIIVIINESNQIEQATTIIPKSDNIQRFFIFIGKRPTVGELSFINNEDNYLILEDANKLGQLAIEMTIRAGILYSQANYFNFCLSSSLPSIANIEQTFNKLEQNASRNIIDIITSDKTVGISRESLLFSGFNDMYQKINDLVNNILNLSSDVQYDLSQAISGTPSPEVVIIQAIKEFVLLSEVKIESSNKETPILKLIKNEILSYSENKPRIIIFTDIIDKSKLKSACNKIPNDGVVIYIVDNLKQLEELPEPYQTLKVDTGEIILIYVHGSIK
jgi:hypothetical protein